MKYLPNLIPEKSRVLTDYFKGDVYQARRPNAFLTFLGWVLSICIFIVAVMSIKHFALAIIIAVLGFIFLPPGHKWIQRVGRFQMNYKIKAGFCCFLILCILPLKNYYQQIDVQEERIHKLQLEKIAFERKEAQKKDMQRKDSMSFYIQKSHELKNKHKTQEALEKLNKALTFAKENTEIKFIYEEQVKILSLKAVALVKSGNYKGAITELNSLISKDANNIILRYNRAICYNKLGKTQEAVTELKVAIQLGSKEAEKLYEKINPIRKRIVDYVTRCCDGSTSQATGRGACSHHGGVCNWNEPVYEEYRKYE